MSIGDAKLWPDTISTLEALKARGIRLAVLSNSYNPVEMRFYLDTLGLTAYFDKIVISGEVGLAKPSGQLI